MTKKVSGRSIGKSQISPLQMAAVVLLFGSVTVVVPGALNRFVFGKLAAAALAAGLTAFAPPAGRMRRNLRINLSLGAGVLLLAAVTSAMPGVALLGRSPRYEGAFVLATYVAMVWAGARLLGPQRSDQLLVTALRVLAGSVLLILFFAILEATGLRPLSTNVSRPGSLMGNASDEGAIGALCFAPLLLVALDRKERLVGAGAAAAAVLTVLSASRGALLALLAEVAIIAVLRGGRRAIAACVASIVLVTGLAFTVPATRDRVIGTSGLAQHTVTGRGLLWRETLSLDAAHLGLGVGPSNFKSAIASMHDREWQQKVGPQEPPDSPHSLLLQALSAGGLPLVLLLLVLAGQVAAVGGRRAWRDRRRANVFELGTFVALVGYALTAMVGFTSPGPTLLASIFLGIALSTQPSDRPRPRSQSVITRTALIGLTALFVLAAVAEIPLRRAILDVSAGDIQNAQHSFEVAHALRLWDVDLADVAAHSFVTYGIATDNDEALEAAKHWLARIPTELRRDEQVALDTASVLEAQRDYAKARGVLTSLLALDRDNPAIFLQRGIVEAEAGDASAAERDFLAAASVDPTAPGPWQDLATLYRTQGRSAEAQRAAANAQRLGNES